MGIFPTPEMRLPVVTPEPESYSLLDDTLTRL